MERRPETVVGLRGRIEVVLASAQVAGCITRGPPNPARWKNWLDHKLPSRRSSARAAITRRWLTSIFPLSWQGSRRRLAWCHWRCSSPS